MKTVHRTTIVGKCPHGCPDVYSAEFHVVDRVITVESIQAAIDAETREPVYQEDLTQRLANRVGCNVVTLGTHGRFETECRAEPVTPPTPTTVETSRYAFTGFDAGSFCRMLGACADAGVKLDWIACPDVVCDDVGTFRLWGVWRKRIEAFGYLRPL